MFIDNFIFFSLLISYAFTLCKLFLLFNRLNEEFTSLLANVLDFIAQVTESLYQTNEMPKLSCFYNRLVRLRKSFIECKTIVSSDAKANNESMIQNTISPINLLNIHEDLNIFTILYDDSCDESNSTSEKSF